MLHLIYDLWHRQSVFTPVLGIYTGTQYLHRHLACYTWYMIYDTSTRYLHRYSVFTPALGMLHLIHDIWHRYSVFTPALGTYTNPCHAIFDTGIFHAIFDIWYLTSILAMLYLTLDIWHRYLTCYIYHLIYNTVLAMIYLTLDTCITWHIHDHYVTRHLTPLYLLNSCTPEPLKKGDSWYYTPDTILMLTPVVR